jgi:hypothetical protein
VNGVLLGIVVMAHTGSGMIVNNVLRLNSDSHIIHVTACLLCTVFGCPDKSSELVFILSSLRMTSISKAFLFNLLPFDYRITFTDIQ